MTRTAYINHCNAIFLARVLAGAVQPAAPLRMLPQDMASEARPLGSTPYTTRLGLEIQV